MLRLKAIEHEFIETVIGELQDIAAAHVEQGLELRLSLFVRSDIFLWRGV